MTSQRAAASRLQEMVKLGVFVYLTTILFFSVAIAAVRGGDGGGLDLFAAASGCRGTLAECFAGEDFQMPSEISRRVLATSQYISYAALQRNSVPCSRRGASYYNCRAGANANPYRRGCSAITRCRS